MPAVSSKAFPTATGGIARLAYGEVCKARKDAKGLLKATQLTVQQITDDSVRIATSTQIKFLNLAADILKDEFLGIHLAQQVDLREIGLLYYVLASSETLQDALQRAARYSVINNEGVSLGLHLSRSTSIAFRFAGISRLSDRHQIEFFATVLVRICRRLTGRNLTPQAIKFMHRRKYFPPGVQSFFGCPVTFGNDADEISYPAKSIDSAVVSADPYLNSLLEKYCQEAVAARKSKQRGWRFEVQNAIAQLLPHGEASMSKVCRRLGVGERTLARRLASEKLTFTDVLDALRHDLARRYLREPELPISEIAWLLGYRQVSSFDHAFKRWTGIRPSRARAGRP